MSTATGSLVDMTSPAAPVATPVAEHLPDTMSEADLPWLCICWDDPVNLMSYVTYVFQTVLGYSRKRATALMMEVHTQGKAVVSSGDRDKVEADVKKLQTAGLWATMQRSEG
ncbi:ATP-dependent Clp protease adaptor protein [Corynebacterium terpenotabidum Y-11]|uniref:ATP-dependent Clp protease adapter protein ClpS n=2 Tax=Corynebacterium terpenotabidum TaxID=89154 RepID=S4XI51_9CORY|nr:ATP-dependent Clp protease adaptor protein [Corynebacterium terpenotabidum Y-11]